MPVRVYVTYDRDESPAFVDNLLELAARLRSEGVDFRLDKYEVAPGEGWARWISGQMLGADFVLVVCTPTYCARFQDVSRGGRHEQWEAAIVYGLLFEHPEFRSRIIPILLHGYGDDCVPQLLRDSPRYRLPTQYVDLYRRLTDQPRITRPLLGPVRSAITNLSSVPRSTCFVGRHADLAQIHRALTTSDAPTPACLALIALGGTGKSRLALEYAHEHADGYDVRWC